MNIYACTFEFLFFFLFALYTKKISLRNTASLKFMSIPRYIMQGIMNVLALKQKYNASIEECLDNSKLPIVFFFQSKCKIYFSKCTRVKK